MKISIASWNVEHFRGEEDRVSRVLSFLAAAPVPDVFALLEVEGKDLYTKAMRAFPNHRFHLTEGPQTQEIFLAIHKRFQWFTTQRLEFKTQRSFQRPGLFVTIRDFEKGEEEVSLLFLHLKSGNSTEDFGLRDAALNHAFNLKKALDNVGQPNFVFLGDLNTMGIDDWVPYSRRLDFPGAEELVRLSDWSSRRGMRVVPKSKNFTWWNGEDRKADLDHVVASQELKLYRIDGEEGIDVLGLVDENWTKLFSDHGLLYFYLETP